MFRNSLFLIFLSLLFIPGKLPARPIIADLALRSIEINTSFRGINILLFGAREDAGDIVVVVRGPEHNYVVRKKERIAGVWINQSQKKMSDVASFYAIASSKPLLKIDNDYLLTALGLGIDNWSWKATKEERFDANDEFSKAFYETKQKSGLYAKEVGDVTFWGETLFRTNIKFPANIPGGVYTAEVYLISDGQVMSVQSTPITVKKVGFEAFTYEFAHRHAVIYGLFSILAALAAGWVSNIIFSKYR